MFSRLKKVERKPEILRTDTVCTKLFWILQKFMIIFIKFWNIPFWYWIFFKLFKFYFWWKMLKIHNYNIIYFQVLYLMTPKAKIYSKSINIDFMWVLNCKA